METVIESEKVVCGVTVHFLVSPSNFVMSLKNGDQSLVVDARKTGEFWSFVSFFSLGEETFNGRCGAWIKIPDFLEKQELNKESIKAMVYYFLDRS